MSFPYSYSILGLAPGLILTVVVAAIVLYTSLITWQFCLRHPEVRDVCDLGQMLFWNSKVAWWATAVMFILNNTFIQALHVLTGAKVSPTTPVLPSKPFADLSQYLNTMTDNASGVCTVGFSAITVIVSWLCSLPRTFDTLSKLATLSAFFTFISVLLATIFAGIESHPADYTPDPSQVVELTKLPGGPPVVLAVPAATTTFVAGLNAFLNIR